MISLRGPKLKIFAAVLAMIATAAGIYMMFFESRGFVSTTATITDMERSYGSGDDDDTFIPTVEYTFDGKTYTGQLNQSSGSYMFDNHYTYQAQDQIVFDGNYYGENAKTSKVDAIVREIGQQPVLAFGNSSGDLAMEIYTISNNPYRTPVQVSYLGPAGTYTEAAAQLFFRNGEILNPKETVDQTIADLLSGEADYAVIPQENTVGGAVLNYVDALIGAEDAFVVGEVILPISQTLMGVPGATLADVKTVCSHAQGLMQSAQWRAENLPDAATEEMASTAAAASYVAETGDKSVAAVAAPGAAALYGLEVLAENVQITDANKTRFYVLSSRSLEGEGMTRAVLIATCEANRIDDIIIRLHDAGLELVTIHDRPEGTVLGAYHYVIEIENTEGIAETQLDAVRVIDEVRFAGCFDVFEK